MRNMLLTGVGLVAAGVGSMLVPSAVHAQGSLPPGSWQNSCSLRSIDTTKGTMDAICAAGIADGDDELYFGNPNFQYSDCGEPIANRSGQLSCAVDQSKLAARLKKEADAKAAADASAAAKEKADADLKFALDAAEQVAAATPGMRAAAVMILGRDLGNDEIRKLVMTARVASFPESRAAIFAKEFDFAAASAFLKKYLGRPGGEKYRDAAVDAAFLQVFGRASTPGEQIDYYNQISAGKAWYASIVGDLMPGIAPGSQVRTGIAQRVAERALGRDPSLAELKQWLASGQNYGTMVEGVRQQFWGGGDADSLILTVQRALTKLGRPSDDAAVKAAVAAWRPMKAIYSEMIGPVGRAKLGNGRPASPIRS